MKPESAFFQIFNPEKSNIIVGAIYRHPSIDLTDFNCNYFKKLLQNISKKQKSVFLIGDFNVNPRMFNLTGSSTNIYTVIQTLLHKWSFLDFKPS